MVPYCTVRAGGFDRAVYNANDSSMTYAMSLLWALLGNTCSIREPKKLPAMTCDDMRHLMRIREQDL